MKNTTPSPVSQVNFSLSGLIWLLAALGLLAATLFVAGNFGGPAVDGSASAEESLRVEEILLEPGRIDLLVRNTGSGELTIAQVTINGAAWLSLTLPGPIVEPGAEAAIRLDDYEWLAGKPYEIVIFTSRANAFPTYIASARATFQPTNANVNVIIWLGIVIGLLPVLLGLLWYPGLGQFGRQGGLFLAMLSAVGLGLLGLKLVADIIEWLDAPFEIFGQGGLLVLGGVGLFVGLNFLGRYQEATGADQLGRQFLTAQRIALGVGLFSLGQGIILGGEIGQDLLAPGAWSVTGLLLVNLIKGLGIISPLPAAKVTGGSIGQLALMGIVGGFPAILGVWFGVFYSAPLLTALLLGAGLGAVAAVVYQLIALQGSVTQDFSAGQKA